MGIPRRPRRSYHPSQEGAPRGAVRCPARSPVAGATASAVGRATHPWAVRGQGAVTGRPTRHGRGV
ncbi:hypothetical protein EOT10_08595 [Streptomyces antnestii]|uniref:Uncharacterized protein n=1 Tax=Streptomyces antnestii TaxID=2494256 RepID=A0A3S2XWT7_9ACTN|nr:hypothetical protein EOT10_08595 [Streptomyces sp. San01]